MINQKFNVYLDNHPDKFVAKSSLAPFLQLVKNYKISNKLKKNSVNLILENFFDKDINRIINFKKKNPNSVLIIVLSEQFNHKLGILNHFSIGQNLLIKFFIQIIFNLIKILILIKNFNYQNKKFQKTRNNKFSYKDNFIFNLNRMKRRYNNTLKVIDLFDIVLTNHPKILNDKILKNKRKFLIPFIYKFNKNRNKKNFLGFSGSFNNYRRSLLKKKLSSSDDDFFVNNINHIFKIYKNKFFAYNYENKNFSKFTLNMPIEKNWNFNSNTRIYNSLKNGELVINYLINDSFLKKLTINQKYFNEKGFQFLKKNYTKIIKKLNLSLKKTNLKTLKDIKKINYYLNQLS